MDKMSESSETDEKGDSSVTVKGEINTEDTIKNYAESTMNELLGLFGYEDKVNSTDTENLNLDNYTENREAESDDEVSDNISKDDNINTTISLKSKLKHRLATHEINSLAQQHMNLVSALKRRETDSADSARETVDKDKDRNPECAWCRKPGNKQFALDTPTGNKVFCSEVCFTQCRRASFKKSKICDWCKHVRHTVNYVEFQDGETQLQFCSDKCLNQYKMSIFCKETQEHLQKISENGDDASVDKDNEKEILITPELWLSGEQARRAADAKRSARERARLERSHQREGFRKSYTGRNEASSMLSKLDSSDNEKVSLIERIKNETNIKHKLNAPTRDGERVSPARSESKILSPQPHTLTPIQHHLMHPALAGMGPWLQQAQLVGSLGPGINPYGNLPPMLFPGFMSPFPGGVHPEIRPPTQEQEITEREKRHIKKEPTSHGGPLQLSPNSERSTTSDISSNNDIQNTTRPLSPSGLSERRTSSLFPVDFPQMFQNQGFSTAHLQPPVPGMSETRQPIPPTTPTGIPPVTMMVPFPVPLPFPVAVPIPIPLTMAQLTKYFGHKTEKSASSFDSKSLLKIPTEKTKESRSPRPVQLHSPQSVCSSSASDFICQDNREIRSGSRNSCPDLSQSFSTVDRHSSLSETFSYKRSRTPDEPKSLDLSKSAKLPKYDFVYFNSNSNDEVIDLSASRLNGHKSDESSSENGLINGVSDIDDKSVTRDSNDNLTDDGPPVPKIHIITHQDESPLNQALPLPPTENPYSTRRGLILDAPVIPKKSRSPSPERRIYVRNVPRDIIEAARRRCMRTRIRTK